ncbi:MAG: anaerobic ribonucleoside-triphosphate reductase activating protein [Eubacteriales bacterium]|nr:anaerobic ribonucleoside-triphosphate reductase activating protein [Eubacteriales bacterium]
MNYGELKKVDSANGPGVRVTLFVSGCRNHCPGCFNRDTWDFAYGKPYTEETEKEILDALSPEYINGFTVLGGEPFEEENQPEVAGLLKKIREKYPKKNIWCYTGYTLEKDLMTGGSKHTEVTDEMLSCIDVLVDGRFIQAEKDLTLAFRGSRNQRLLKLRNGKAEGEL